MPGAHNIHQNDQFFQKVQADERYLKSFNDFYKLSRQFSFLSLANWSHDLLPKLKEATWSFTALDKQKVKSFCLIVKEEQVRCTGNCPSIAESALFPQKSDFLLQFTFWSPEIYIDDKAAQAKQTLL